MKLLVTVGAEGFDLDGVPLERRPWSADTEVQDLLSFDVGLMPLADDPWARGKCGFKLIQYMAAGLPVVASPVGVNSYIVESGKSGFLPSAADGWTEALRRLHDDPAFAFSMGRAGRRRVEEEFCLQKTGPRFVAGVRRALTGD